ncbi:hypothetical protein SAMN04487962_12520 [Marinobacter segnicrescens]|uniref:Phage gp6-like head-tail connector protein n=1 Tax=Marinobacter segnicrescens TaxID=430453 RepID=A0A1I0H7W4_9GAMM|nr:hypothetical protein [Marinobacter segnicrescens]SET79798.1 hypothetical protein SAMN04487962_12520 [Marinobacter segnicrescens]
MALVRFEKIRDLIDLEGPVSSGGEATLDDFPQLAVLLDSVKASIESYIGRYIEQDSYTESGWIDSNEIPLRALPVKKIKSVTVDVSPIDLDQIRISRAGITLPSIVPRGTFNDVFFEVKYQGGFDEIPADIERAALLQVLYEYNRLPHIGATSVSNDGGSVQTPELGLLREVRNLLDKHKNFGILGV